ncbi:peptidoglycan D,D-transpeptidase FtsI family protein [Algisphaera agarilytica]|uniref:Cell division protein FtsI (Penicillin-binding protein 3) n=1 Tax=Algisphaera agarilytica TaxID=1385975 RepID=A0A7X0H8D3_9BACT|nr:penicillin-binding protein 2 [Algisphaera agarilytica]MBB6431153.1 cell division protein FtsI (penicillin-binding protein 3) [Algisphaera agarilytica]
MTDPTPPSPRDPAESPTRVVPDTAALERNNRRALSVGRVAMVLVTIALLALLGRVYQLQQHPSPRIAAMIDTQISTRDLDARRGSLVDRRQRVLATTRVAHRLFIDPDIVEDPNTFSETVGYTLGYDPAWIEQQLFKRRGSRYIVIDKQMPEETYELYQQTPELLELRGLSSHPILVRDYPQAQLAGQLVGFIGHEGKGLDGLERAYDDRLAPDPGQHAFVYDRGRNRLWLANQNYKLQADGKPIRLSIDLNLQAIAEEELEATVTKFEGESGQLIIMDPRTGEVLALANYPFFNPADFRDEKGRFREDAKLAQRNRSVTDVFEPGSIVKPLVWAASIEGGYATASEMIDTTDDGMWKPQRGPLLKDSSYGPGKGHGEITYEEVLVQSSNIGMAVVAERMGMDALHKILDSYGFGKVTGSELPGEIKGMFRPVSKWSWTDLTRMPMGHGIAVTPLQVTRAFCALANDGVLVNPTIEARADDTEDERRTNITARVLSPRVAENVREVLARVVTEGTGRRARSDLYDLFGKTGTAELPDLKNGGYHDNLYSSSFIAGAPVDQPRLVVGCFVHKTTKRIVDGQYTHYGGVVSGPAVKRVMERSLIYLGVPTKEDTEVTTDTVADRSR